MRLAYALWRKIDAIKITKNIHDKMIDRSKIRKRTGKQSKKNQKNLINNDNNRGNNKNSMS